MKTTLRLVAILLVIGITAFSVSIFWSREPVLLYEDAHVSVSRSGGSLIVLEAQTGAVYRYRLKRTRRATSGPQEARTSVRTETLTVLTVYDILIITEPDGTLYLKVR